MVPGSVKSVIPTYSSNKQWQILRVATTTKPGQALTHPLIFEENVKIKKKEPY